MTDHEPSQNWSPGTPEARNCSKSPILPCCAQRRVQVARCLAVSVQSAAMLIVWLLLGVVVSVKTAHGLDPSGGASLSAVAI